MNKYIKKTISICLIAMVTLMFNASLLTTTSFGASGSCSVSAPGTVTVGQSFTVTVYYSGGNIGTIIGSISGSGAISGGGSYSGGSDGSSAVGSFSQSFTMTANSVGTGYVSANTISASTFDPPDDMYFNSASATVTVVAPAKPSSGGSTSGGSSASKKKSKTDDPQAEKEAKKDKDAEAKQKAEAEKKSQKPAAIEVDVAGTKYTIVEDFKNTPEGFEKTSFLYGQYKWKINGIKSNDGKYKLLRVKNSKTGEQSWMFYDEANSKLDPNTTLSAKDIIALYENTGDDGLSIPIIIAFAILGLAVVILAVLLIMTRKKYVTPRTTIAKSPLEEQPRKEINTKDYSNKH